jgi:hypothetical protein
MSEVELVLPASLEMQTRSFEYNGTKYWVTEATEAAAVEWRDKNLQGMKVDDGKVMGFDRISMSEPTLVQMCTYEADEEGQLPRKDGRPDVSKRVPFNVVSSWPSRLVKPLFTWIKDVSDLGEMTSELELLYKALETGLSPVKLKEFRDFIASLDDEEYKKLKLWFRTPPSVKAKNELRALPASSG